jgi:hypothetical protein
MMDACLRTPALFVLALVLAPACQSAAGLRSRPSALPDLVTNATSDETDDSAESEDAWLGLPAQPTLARGPAEAETTFEFLEPGMLDDEHEDHDFDGLYIGSEYIASAIGFGVAWNTSGGGDDDASALLVHVKAYPWKKWYESDEATAGRCPYKQRFSVVAGASLGKFSGDFDAPFWVLGAGFDVTPQFALIAGAAFVDADDTDVVPYLGFSFDGSTLVRIKKR